MNKQCLICLSDLSAWEGDTCISCTTGTSWGWSLSNPERALRVLESEDGPVSVYDVCRGIKREFGITANENSISSSLASDLRFCWAGRGMYGLYRHGLLPGPRNLSGVARFILYSSGRPLSIRILSFLMQFMGYRFHPQSLINALARDPDVTNLGWQEYDIDRSDEAAFALNFRLWCAPSMQAFQRIVSRCRRHMIEGIKEYKKRTDRD